jgi:hypothetical protein
MTKRKTLANYTLDQMRAELDRRWAVDHFKPGMTMSQMELTVWKECGMESPAALRHLEALLTRLPLEKPTGKLCPKCGKRAPVKAKDRERTLRTMAGHLTLTRNYHYCERCEHGFYPLDLALDLPEEGELTYEMEKRVLDFAVNDVFNQGAERWNVHYRLPISDNLLRRVAARVGAHCEAADPAHLQEALKPATEPAEVLVVEMDGSLVPVRGSEPWKEVKVGVTYRHDPERNAPVRGSARYCAVLGTVANFAPVFEEALIAERMEEVPTVVWLGDGATHNWTLADQLAPDAVQILDWHHAVQHAVACGKALLGEESPYLPLWQVRSEALLAQGDVNALIAELMDCIPEIQRWRRGRHEALTALDNLVRYYRTNAQRMKYALFREYGFPIGSGAVESAHRHVLQCRMKRAGQHWALPNARRMAQLRAAYRTGGARHFHSAILRARHQTIRRAPRAPGRRNGFLFARQGVRDRLRASI